MARNMVFLYKTNEDDRDCCAYIAASPLRFECGITLVDNGKGAYIGYCWAFMSNEEITLEE